jgi:hypothetical protein
MAPCHDNFDRLLGKDMAVHVWPVDARKYAERTGDRLDDLGGTLAAQASCNIGGGAESLVDRREIACFIGDEARPAPGLAGRISDRGGSDYLLNDAGGCIVNNTSVVKWLRRRAGRRIVSRIERVSIPGLICAPTSFRTMVMERDSMGLVCAMAA